MLASITPMWAKQLSTPGTEDNDFCVGAGTDAAGNVYVSGWTAGEVFAGEQQGSQDAFLTKYSKAGSLVWSEQFGSTVADVVYDVAIDASGNAYTVGYTDDDAFPSEPYYEDAVIAKFNASGVRQHAGPWWRQFGTSVPDDFHSVAVDSAGNLYATGMTLGNLAGTNPVTLPDADGGAHCWDGVLFKLASDGSETWRVQFGSPTHDDPWSVSTNAANDLYVAGNTWGDMDGEGPAVAPGMSAEDAFVMRCDPASGATLWVRQIVGSASSYEAALGSAVDASGNVYVAGSTNGDIDGAGPQQHIGLNDIFINKYDASGTLLWSRQYGTTSDEQCQAIQVVSIEGVDHVLISGWTNGDLFGSVNFGSADAFVALLDAGGNVETSALFGTSAQDASGGVAFDGTGGVYLVGQTKGALGQGGYAGGWDAFVAYFILDMGPSGPPGYGDEHWYGADGDLDYMVSYVNDTGSGSEPVEVVRVVQTLDPDLDFSTFRLGTIALGDTLIEDAAGQTSYDAQLDLRESLGVFADVSAGIDMGTGEVFWEIQASDPAPGPISSDALVGFLSSRSSGFEGRGFVSYSVKPKATVASGDRVDTVATITFDQNEPITIAGVFNTIDADAPTSSVEALPADSYSCPGVLLDWSGQDGAGEVSGSGVAGYDIYVSADGGPFAPWLAGTTATEARYTEIVPGHRYAFYSVAVDHVGNRESPPITADAQTLVIPPELVGRVESKAIQDQSPGEGDIWYEVEASRTGFLTIQSISQSGTGQLELFEADGERLAGSSLAAGATRVDYQAMGGDVYYLRLSGSSTDVDLRITNLVNHTATNVSVSGTTKADDFQFNAEGPWLSIGGVRYDFVPGTASSFSFDGGAGANTATMWGSSSAAQKDSALLYATRGTMSGAGYSLSLAGMRGVTVNGNGGPDEVMMYDSSLDDTFTAYPTYATLSNSRFTNRAEGFRNVWAYAQAGGAFSPDGGTDTACLYGIDGAKDFLRASANYATLADSETGRGTTYFIRANWFEQVDAFGREVSGRPSGVDRDQAILCDAGTTDLFEADAAAAVARYLYSGGSDVSAYTFRVIKAYGSAGDAANLYGPGQYQSVSPVMWTADYSAWANGFDSIAWHPSGRPAASSRAAATDAALSMLLEDGFGTTSPRKKVLALGVSGFPV